MSVKLTYMYRELFLQTSFTIKTLNHTINEVSILGMWRDQWCKQQVQPISSDYRYDAIIFVLTETICSKVGSFVKLFGSLSY